MHIGQYISGGAHAVLIGAMLFGGVFSSTPEPLEVTGVDILTTEQFDAIVAGQRSPEPVTEIDTPVAPELNETAPDLKTQTDPVTPPPVPDTPQPTPQEPTPIIPEPTPAPLELSDVAPEITPPEPETSAPLQSPRPVARPVRRVAPEPVAAPEPDRQIAEIDQAPTTPSEVAEPVEEAPEPTAREEAATEIPTEPKDVSSAPTRSVRPKARPQRPQQSASQNASSAADTSEDTRDTSVNDALAQALADTPAAPSGPPLTQGERDALRLSVQNCWVVDVGSQAANVIVTVAMSLDRDGKVISGSLRQLSAQGGDENAARVAFNAARRAILRCQKGGYKLPIDKYDHWKDVEMTFNPEKMRRR